MNELEKDFAPFQESLELKQLGFDEPCFGYYDIQYNNQSYNGKLVLGKDPDTLTCTKKMLYIYGQQKVLTPTLSQSFRWFRKKHNLKSWVQEHTADTFIYEIRPHKLTDYREDEVYVYEEYEQAELECLRKLIEIVKNK